MRPTNYEREEGWLDAHESALLGELELKGYELVKPVKIRREIELDDLLTFLDGDGLISNLQSLGLPIEIEEKGS